MSNLEVLKTYKLYIGGAFPRTESGRFYAPVSNQGEVLGNICLSSRKDLRNAVVAARKAQGPWEERSAFNRSQILYRIAELFSDRKEIFLKEFQKQGSSPEEAVLEFSTTLDRIVYYAGWCDKYNQVLSSVNSVNSSHFNFSTCEPMGIVALIAPQNTALIGLVSLILPALAGGNTLVALASETLPISAISFAEVLNDSDVPAGVINILTGKQDEIAPIMASHMDINALISSDLGSIENQIAEACIDNLKRKFTYTEDFNQPESQGLTFIADLQEIKTTWHPIENIGGSTSTY